MEKLVKEAERAIPKPTDRQNLRDCSTSSLLVHLSALCWVYTQLLHSCSHRHDPVQPPMFHTQEAEVAFPSIQAYLTSCKEVRQHTHAALTHFFCRSQRLAGLRRSPAPQYQPGQKIWLSPPAPCLLAPSRLKRSSILWRFASSCLHLSGPTLHTTSLRSSLFPWVSLTFINVSCVFSLYL